MYRPHVDGKCSEVVSTDSKMINLHELQ